MTTAAGQQLPLWSGRSAEAEWRVRRSARARRLAVRVFHDGTVEVVVPERARPREVQTFVARHQDWIVRQRRRASLLATDFPPDRLELKAIGETWHCQAAHGPAPAACAAVADVRPERPLLREIAPSSGGGVLELDSGADGDALRAAMLEWLSARARIAFAPRLAALAARLGCTWHRLQIRTQRTRWGSCSTRGTISLNVCLLFQRPAVLQYLMVHELAHLRHMNHGPRFWGLVGHYEPQWPEFDRELTRGWSQVPGWLLVALRARSARAAEE
jgi:predicted metal-dependent hydrolase